MSNETTPGWAERRVREAIELGVTLGGFCAIYHCLLPPRLFRFTPPKIGICVTLQPEVSMININIDINFNEEA